MYDIPMRHTAQAAINGGQQFALELVHNGGTGARPTADGLSATAFPSGVYGSQIEVTESVAPVTVWSRELITDSGGAGRYRGGLGQRIEMSSSINEPFMVFPSLERIDNPAQGRAGGMAGAPGRIYVKTEKNEVTCEKDLPGKCEWQVEPGDTLVLETPGGGGFGQPEKRAAQAIKEDVEADRVSDGSSFDKGLA